MDDINSFFEISETSLIYNPSTGQEFTPNLEISPHENLDGGAPKKSKSKSKEDKPKKKVQKVDYQQKLIDEINKNNIDEVKKILKMKGIDLNKKDSDGNIPLHYAVTESDKLVQLLIDDGSKVNATDNKGHTPLHVVVASNILVPSKLKIMRVLFENDVKINKSNDEGKTALHFAVTNNEPKVVRALIEEDAKTNIKDDDGMTPLELAKKYKRRESGSSRKSFQKIMELIDPKEAKKAMKKDESELIIVPSSSPLASLGPLTSDVTIAFEDTPLSPALIVQDDCKLDFNAFLFQYFRYNYNQLRQLLNMEGKTIRMVTKCRPGVLRPRDMPESWVESWNNLSEIMAGYDEKLRIRKLRQELTVTVGDCWSEPAVDLYLLFLMLRTRYLMYSKGIKICPKNAVGNLNPYNKVFIDPTYNINIFDGSERSNLKLRNTFERLIVILEKARLGAYFMVGSTMDPFGRVEYVYLS